MSGLQRRIVDHVRAHGPLRFDEYLEWVLYDPVAGFYEQESGAGRPRDFLTSPEVGPLFGAVLAQAIDTWWDEAGRPERWTVIDAGAGPGALARSLLAAEPRCSPALDVVAVDRSASQRRMHDARFTSLGELPGEPITGVILANELLDNLPWRLLEATDRGGGSVDWVDVEVGVDETGDLVDVLGQHAVDLEGLAAASTGTPEFGARFPLQQGATAWLADALERLELGRCVVLDYASTTASMIERPWSDWTRTYRSHDRGGHPLDGPGTQDITCEVDVDQLARVRAPSRRSSQAEFLQQHGIDELVAEGRRIWTERAHLGDLEAMKARSRVSESEALTDPSGLGAFMALEWSV